VVQIDHFAALNQANPFSAQVAPGRPFLESPTPGRKAVAPAPMCEQKIGQMRF
jgi:hypothetical protein